LEQVVNRYRGAVSMWNVGCGVNVNENFTFTAEQMLDLTRMSSLLARQSRKGARTMMEISHPFSEHAATNRDAMGTFMFVERLIQEGVKVDAIGVQLMMGVNAQGRTTRDMFAISCLLDRFVLLQTPVVISCAGVPSEVIDAHGGTWHEAWSEDVQAQWASRLFPMILSKPFVESFCWADIVDSANSEMLKDGLIEESGKVKSVYAKLTGMRRRLRKPLGAMKSPFKTTSASVAET
ncbi:MAG TPA: hypothetical protein VG711_11020, partial [Phycisphaerales bacterium]|nr:hypothetical protein [Phycisphaerales bacterium]